ncbi:phosphoserine phosphatase SerB [Mesorhizobium sp. LHD-90]|uniref:phosphoserine phosphatase SerB n=1 Tax=Mesorhizobium sp. LHD-90 TaxID=3071414 RepID=UPI0027DF474F|nr:phosphoserine phosphatase SerB [Mesorhizobium sp. LHD-90]MDQ6433532.1 phosphoserine phosphatase SerB [Mesorhizobium sp. LHD-90]
MSLVATLISHPAERALTPALLDMASRALMATGSRWLAAGIACDLALPDGFDANVDPGLTADLASRRIDLVVQPAAGRRKRLLLADMDSTMIDQECIDELADEVGLKDHVAAITARSMNGEIAFEPALRERVALLAGLDAGVIDRIVANRLTLASGGRELVATMRSHGAWTALVSGGFTAFTARIAQKLGFDENRANILLEANGRLSGKVAEPILGREAKAAALVEIAAHLGISTADSIAVGDGANDLDMLALAGAGVALHAKPAVAEQARIRIDHGDLTALLYIQGYAEADFSQ